MSSAEIQGTARVRWLSIWIALRAAADMSLSARYRTKMRYIAGVLVEPKPGVPDVFSEVAPAQSAFEEADRLATFLAIALLLADASAFEQRFGRGCHLLEALYVLTRREPFAHIADAMWRLVIDRYSALLELHPWALEDLDKAIRQEELVIEALVAETMRVLDETPAWDPLMVWLQEYHFEVDARGGTLPDEELQRRAWISYDRAASTNVEKRKQARAAYRQQHE